MSSPTIELIWDAKNELGEGPVRTSANRSFIGSTAKVPQSTGTIRVTGRCRRGNSRPTSGRWRFAKKAAPSSRYATAYSDSTSTPGKPS